MTESKPEPGAHLALWLAAQRNRKPLMFLVLVLALLGVWAYLAAPESVFPQVSFSRVEIFAWAGELPPEEMHAAVTRPLETALQSLPVLESRSFTNQGTAEIELDFDPASDPRTDLQNVQALIAAARPSLKAVTRIETVIQHPNMEPIATYAITSTALNQAQLRYLIEQRTGAVFTGTPGLGRVTVFAGPGLEYRVALDPQALAAAGTTVGEVAQTLADANSAHAAGIIDQGDQRSVVFAGEALSDPRALGAVAIADRAKAAPVPLSSLGKITLGDGPATQQASFDGQHAVLLSAYPIIGADAVSLRHALDARIPALIAGLPSDVRVTRYWDQTRLISASQESLRDAILIGALLALIVIYVFLRSLGITLVAAAIIPMAMAITILIVGRAGMALSLMSLGGLAIAVGLVIDEVIVVIESIARALADDPGTPRRLAIARATGRIARALIGSTAANVVVFLPLGLLSGIPGFFFRALAITLGISLVVSILLSLGVAPVLTDMLWRPKALRARRLGVIEPAYVRLLAWALRRRGTVYLAGLGVLAVTGALFLRLESDFLPGLNEGEFEIIYELPAGTSLAATDRIVSGLEKIILADPAVEHEGRLQGVDTDGYEPTPQNAGTIRIWLKASGPDRYEAVADRLRKSFAKAAPGANFEFHQLLEDQLNDLSGAPEPIQIEVTGREQDKLIEIADGITAQISKIPGIVDAFDGVTAGNQTIRVTPKDAGAATMTVGELSDALGAAVGGTVATRIRAGDGTVPVRVGLAERPASDKLEAIEIPTREGLRSLSAVADIGAPTRASLVSERNGARRMLITAGIEGVNLSAVIPEIQAITALVPLPPGYHLSIGGAYKEQQASFREFGFVLAVAVLLVFFVLLATFNSFRIPLVILATIPLSPIGVLLALWLTGTPINVSSIMGLLLLVGIVVRNGILLIDAANRRRREGAVLGDAILGAGAERLRPILMTTFAAIGALLPLALGLGSGAEMLVPLAIAIIGGLSTATAFTLVLIPVLYASVTGGFKALTVTLAPARGRPGKADLIARGLVGATAVAAIAVSVVAVVQATQKVDVDIDYPEGSPQDFAQDWFETHDRNHVGYVTLDEVLNYDAKVFKRFDADHDGKLTFREFAGGIPPDQTSYLAAFHTRFDKMDADHDGTVALTELEDYDRSFLKQIDKQGDARITEAEWFAATIGNAEWYPASVN
jgi:CzcA family heavy metal efflux pump